MGLGCLRENMVAAGGEPGGPGPAGPVAGAGCRRPPAQAWRPAAARGCALPLTRRRPRRAAAEAAPAHPPSPREEPAAWAGPAGGCPSPSWSPPRLPPPPRQGGRLPAPCLSTAGGGLGRALPGRPCRGRAERPPYGGAQGPSGRGPATGASSARGRSVRAPPPPHCRSQPGYRSSAGGGAASPGGGTARRGPGRAAARAGLQGQQWPQRGPGGRTEVGAGARGLPRGLSRCEAPARARGAGCCCGPSSTNPAPAGIGHRCPALAGPFAQGLGDSRDSYGTDGCSLRAAAHTHPPAAGTTSPAFPFLKLSRRSQIAHSSFSRTWT